MQDDTFEWDDAKAASNLKKHGVSFADARLAFEDGFATLEIDTGSEDENRLILTAVVKGRIVVVIFVEREERIRIISARKANRRERHGYYQNQTSS